jgi:hypothetical protein
MQTRSPSTTRASVSTAWMRLRVGRRAMMRPGNSIAAVLAPPRLLMCCLPRHALRDASRWIRIDTAALSRYVGRMPDRMLANGWLPTDGVLTGLNIPATDMRLLSGLPRAKGLAFGRDGSTGLGNYEPSSETSGPKTACFPWSAQHNATSPDAARPYPALLVRANLQIILALHGSARPHFTGRHVATPLRARRYRTGPCAKQPS